jgi:dUTPase
MTKTSEGVVGLCWCATIAYLVWMVGENARIADPRPLSAYRYRHFGDRKCSLFIEPLTNITRDYYTMIAKNGLQYKHDSCVDLVVAANTTVFAAGGELTRLDLGIKAALFNQHGDPSGYYLYPRSSFSTTGLVLGHSPSVMDSNFRGRIDVRVRLVYVNKTELFIPALTRLVQLCTPDLVRPNIVVVSLLDDVTERDHHAFGSSGGTL